MRISDRGRSVRVTGLAFAVSMCFGAPIGAQVHVAPAPTSVQAQVDPDLALRGALAESIVSAKEQARGESFDPTIRAGLKRQMEKLPVDLLARLAQQGAGADIPLALGSVTSDLVYTPVTPCRVFDSRVSQGGPGPIPAGTQRNVFIAGTVGFEAQGGLAGGCGVPVGATSAIINFVTVLPAGPGNIRAWAVAEPQPPAPLAAVMNYGSVAGLPAIANGVAVPLCNPAATSCTFGDLRLQADTNSTDILGDVVGYFRAPTSVPFSLHGCSYVTGPFITGTSAVFQTSTVSCPAGQFAVGATPTWQTWQFASICVPLSRRNSDTTFLTDWLATSGVGSGCLNNQMATMTLCCP